MNDHIGSLVFDDNPQIDPPEELASLIARALAVIEAYFYIGMDTETIELAKKVHPLIDAEVQSLFELVAPYREWYWERYDERQQPTEYIRGFFKVPCDSN